MKVLFVMYDYLPIGSAEANIIKELSVTLIQKDIEVNILTTKSNISQEDVSYINDVKIFRILYGRNLSLRRDKLSSFQKMCVFKQKVLDLFFAKLSNRLFLNKYLVKKIEKAFSKFDLFDYDFYIPVSGYYEMYEATKNVIKKRNKKIFLYQLDPIINNTGYSYKSKKARIKFESELSKNCEVIISTNFLINQKVENNIDISNCYGFEFPNISNLNISENYSVNDTKEILFAGNLSYEIRHPEYVFKMFSKLESDVKLLIAGSGCTEIVNDYVTKFPNRFIYLGKLDSKEIIKKIQKVDYLLNIGNNNINFIPSKIFEYISTGKPVINTYKSEDCPTLQYFEKYKENSISLFEREEILEENVEKLSYFLKDHEGKVLPYVEIEEKFKEHTSKYIGEELYKVFLKFHSNEENKNYRE